MLGLAHWVCGGSAGPLPQVSHWPAWPASWPIPCSRKIVTALTLGEVVTIVTVVTVVKFVAVVTAVTIVKVWPLLIFLTVVKSLTFSTVVTVVTGPVPQV